MKARFERDRTDLYGTEDGDHWQHVRMERMHFYFLVEFLIHESGYAVFDLMAPVTSYSRCHHKSIPYHLMGFVYFLLFEYMYYQRIYKGADAVLILRPRLHVVQYFVDIALNEWRSLEALTALDSSLETIKHNLVIFYG